jgi:O-antigen/teichoic acid export membrane protein
MPADGEDSEAGAATGSPSLLGEIRRLGSQTIVYGIGGIALQVVGVITLPIFARVFEPSDYGIVELGMVMSSICLIVVDGGMASASQRSFFDHGDDEQAIRRRILSTALLFQLALGALMALVLAAIAGPLSEALFDGRDEPGMLVLIGITLPALAAAQFTREVLRLHFRAWSYVTASVAGAVVGTVVSVLAVVSWDAGVEGPFIGVLAGAVAGAVYGLALVWRDLTARPSRRELSIMLRFGIPLIPTALSLWSLSVIDRVMLGRLADLDELGQYAIAARIGLPVLLIVTAFSVAFSPFTFSLYQQDPEHEKRVRGRVLLYLTAALSGLALVVGLFAREVVEVVAPAFDESFEAVGLVAFGLALFGISGVVVSGISISRQTHWLALYSVVAAVVNIVLNLVLIPPLGQVGAALATLVSYAVLTALYYHRAQLVYPTPYRLGAVVGTIALGLALVPLGAIEYDDTLVGLVVRCAALVVFAVALRVTGVVRPQDLRRAVAWVRGVR